LAIREGFTCTGFPQPDADATHERHQDHQRAERIEVPDRIERNPSLIARRAIAQSVRDEGMAELMHVDGDEKGNSDVDKIANVEATEQVTTRHQA